MVKMERGKKYGAREKSRRDRKDDIQDYFFPSCPFIFELDYGVTTTTTTTTMQYQVPFTKTRLKAFIEPMKNPWMATRLTKKLVFAIEII